MINESLVEGPRIGDQRKVIALRAGRELPVIDSFQLADKVLGVDDRTIRTQTRINDGLDLHSEVLRGLGQRQIVEHKLPQPRQ